MQTSSRALLALATLGLLLAASTLAAQEPASSGRATLSGRVLTPEGHPLPGATLYVVQAAAETRSDAWGAYRISGLAAGHYTVVVSYLGCQTATVELELLAGASEHDLALEPEVYHEMVTVHAEPFLEGQAKALNQQKSAINIKNIVASDQIGRFPDPNSAEATQRIPGVTLYRDQGEGRYVQVRGTEPRLSSAMINGERIPSPEGGVRYVALDVIPAELLEAIEVSKALTPDMDGDSIGGAVNLLTRRAPVKMQINGSLGAGYNDQSQDGIGTASFSYGSRFGQGRDLGLLLSGSALETDRGTDAFEVEYDDGELADLQLRDYLITRERYGLTGDLDYSLSPRSDLAIRGIYNRYDDLELRRRHRSRLDKDRIEKEYKDRFETQRIVSLSASGSSIAGNSILLDYRVSWAEAEEDEPGRMDTTFRQKKVQFDPNVSPDHIDPDNIRSNPLNEDLSKFTFDDIAEENNFTSDEDVVASLDVSVPFYLDGGTNGHWQFGTKLRAKDKLRIVDFTVWSSDDDIFLTDFLDPDFDAAPFLSGRYDLGQFSRRDTPQLLAERFNLDSEPDLEENLASYSASEDTVALYGMTEVAFGKRVKLLGGARWESTNVEYGAFELVFDEEGDPSDLTPVDGRNDFGELLPMVHFVYQVGERSNLRAAVTRSLARPDYSDLAPFQLLNEEDLEIVRGNPALDVTTAWNLDLLYEKYLSSVGVLAVGVFHKEVEDNIFRFRSEEVRGGEIFDVTQPRNGENGSVTGLELAFQNQLRSLPAPFDGLGIYANLTLTDSEADAIGRALTRLPGQADTVGNFALGYEKHGFSGRLSFNYHGEYIFGVGSDASRDLWVYDHFQVDFSATQQLTDRLRLFLEVINLGDEPYGIYEGTSDRPIRYEYYSWWGTIGLKVSL